MEFSIKRAELVAGLGMVQNIVERKSSMPILAHVCMTAQNENIQLAATDLELGFQGSFAAQVTHPGDVAVPARKLYEIARELTCEDVFVRLEENNWISVKGGQAQFRLFGLSTEDFPGLPKFDHLKTIEMGAEQLSRMIECTVFSTAAEDTYFHTSGIYVSKLLDAQPPALRMVATDGHRLAIMDTPLESAAELEFEGGVVISKKGISEISRLVERCETVRLGIGNDSAVVMGDRSLLSIRLLESKFPNYEMALVENEPIKVEMNKRFLQEVLRRMHVMTSENHRGLRIQFSKDSMEVFLNNPEIGDANEKVEISYRNRDIGIGINPKYVLDVLGHMESENVTIGLVDEEHGCTIRGEVDPGFVGIIMPIVIA